MIENLLREINELLALRTKHEAMWSALWKIVNDNDVKWTDEEARQGVEFIIARYIAELKAKAGE